MRKNKPSPNNFLGTDWQLLVELELSVSSSMDEKVDINVWLAEVLSPLELHIDYFNRVLSSAQDAIARAMPTLPMTEFAYIHLLIFVPADRTSNRQMWGFFRIEKMEGTKRCENPPSLAVEFYLYQPGHKDKLLA